MPSGKSPIRQVGPVGLVRSPPPHSVFVAASQPQPCSAFPACEDVTLRELPTNVGQKSYWPQISFGTNPCDQDWFTPAGNNRLIHPGNTPLSSPVPWFPCWSKGLTTTRRFVGTRGGSLHSSARWNKAAGTSSAYCSGSGCPLRRLRLFAIQNPMPTKGSIRAASPHHAGFGPSLLKP